VPAGVLGAALATSWALMFSGGMRAVVGWVVLISVGQILALPALLAVGVHAIRKRRLSRPMALTLVLGLVGVWPALWGVGLALITFPASREKTAPSATVRLPSNETLRVAWGGDRVAVNRHAATPDQRWAYDLMVEPGMSGSSRLEDYGCYGTTVVAPAAARVHDATDGEPDQTPGKLSPNFKAPLGNNVVLALPTGTYLVIAHLKPGSVLVHAGDQVAEGQPIGACGNSGNTSEPHIHIHHQRQDPKGRPLNFSEGLPLYFRDLDGPPMPEGGVERRDGKPVLVGAVVRHRGAR
jgi:hypothetical protein